MNIEKHPSPALLVSYASGLIPRAPALIIICHLEACPACRAKVALLEEAGGRLMDSMAPTPLSADAFDRLMARIDTEGPVRHDRLGSARSEMLGDVLLPPAVVELGVAPRRWMGPGLWTAHLRLPPQDNWRAFVLRAPAGQRIPRHRHVGHELISVLQGAFREGLHYEAGEFQESGPDSAHGQEVTPEGACACLIAVQGEIEWRGMARLIRPMLGI